MSDSHSNILIWYWGRTGAGPQITLELARALRDAGDREIAVSLSAGCDNLADFQRLGLPLHLVSTYSSLGGAALASLALPFKAAALIAFCRAQRIGTVISTMPHLWTPYMQRRLKSAGLRLVSLIHDASAHRGEIIGLRMPALASLYGRLRAWLTRAEIRQADQIFTLSDSVRKQLQQLVPPGIPVAVLPWGSYGSQSAKPARRFPTGPFRFLFFGRLMEYKGLNLLLAAFALLRQRGIDCRLLIAGDGPQQLQDLPAGVALIQRWIPDGEIAELFGGVDAVVLPYLEASQSGVIPLATAHGLPCIATPVGGLPEQIRHEVTGIVAAGIQADALADAMQRLCSDAALYERCSEAIRRIHDSGQAWRDAAAMIARIAAA